MPYTVWSGDTLIGESELAPLPDMSGTLGGMFSPTSAAASVLDTFGALFDALNNFGEKLQREENTREHNVPHPGQAVYEAMGTAEGRKMSEHQSAVDALELRLRDPEGVLVNTQTIGIADTRRMLGLAFDDIMDEELAEGSAASLTNYFLTVTLVA
jgi:hypothetical protein